MTQYPTDLFRAPYAPDDHRLVQDMIARNQYDPALKTKITERARGFIQGIRDTKHMIPGLEEFMLEYDLSTKEGLALMVMAEALLRVPDAETQNRLIEEKLGQGDWSQKEHSPDDDTTPKPISKEDDNWLLMAASWGIGLSAKIVSPGESPGDVLHNVMRRLGTPVIRTGARQAMQYLGHHFVLGETIEAAMKRADKQRQKGFRFSFDMLGEGARTADDAARYYKAYEDALESIGKDALKRDPHNETTLPNRPGLSVKISAIHPRYEAIKQERVMDEIVPKLIALAERAKKYNLNFTIDAEEADRLEISLDIFTAVAKSPSLAGWDGYGLAVQAYQKRAPEVVDYVINLATSLNRTFMVRLVKGAYWDTEIKRAQETGIAGYPVFTKKTATDLCYLDCAKKMLDARPHIFPQFATHNALTCATILEMADAYGNRPAAKAGFEFQRLHGMGEELYNMEIELNGVPARIYAPVGGYKDLLAYLVRRLLENSANSSFVAQVADDQVPIADLLELPQDELSREMAAGGLATHDMIDLPINMFRTQNTQERANSDGADMGDYNDRHIFDNIKHMDAQIPNHIGFDYGHGIKATENLTNPSNGKTLCQWAISSNDDINAAFENASAAQPIWNAMPITQRAKVLRKLGEALQENRDLLLAQLSLEAGKTLDDGLAEIREAIDFCWYYADEGERLFNAKTSLPGPVGEDNDRHLHGRGVIACISPWNFPLAIFLGQIAAALITGNSVIAKPAEQTPLIAHTVIRMLNNILDQQGLPDMVKTGLCQLLFGYGETGNAIVQHNNVAGVVFTGSTQVARIINQTLAAKDGPIVPLIAETGGINAMIVDSTALPEQVADDVVNSAFKSAGQRCSALRVLYIQDDVADKMIHMIKGATAEMQLGNPIELATDIGPVIDAEAHDNLTRHIADLKDQNAKCIYKANLPENNMRHTDKLQNGTFFAPHIFEVSQLDGVKREAFGPILHIVRWKSDQIDNVIKAINGTGYGLTFGLHSRLENFANYVVPQINAGNIYINRNMIGAVVGVQPFGGSGLSGTGPKAGGPLYLTRFVEEKTISNNITAAGGNASLIAMS